MCSACSQIEHHEIFELLGRKVCEEDHCYKNLLHIKETPSIPHMHAHTTNNTHLSDTCPSSRHGGAEKKPHQAVGAQVTTRGAAQVQCHRP